MFSGIIQTIGAIQSINNGVFCFKAQADFFTHVSIGDSIAVNGVCLTVTEINDDNFKADVSLETLQCSILGNLKLNDNVNLEKALRLNQGIDGHLVSGHVDGVAKVVERFTEGESTRFKMRAPQNLVKYIARKGSVCINGVSLTVNDIDADVFDINIVPHTLAVTTLSNLKVGSGVNLEVDIIARHLEQLLKQE